VQWRCVPAITTCAAVQTDVVAAFRHDRRMPGKNQRAYEHQGITRELEHQTDGQEVLWRSLATASAVSAAMAAWPRWQLAPRMVPAAIGDACRLRRCTKSRWD
jgi:hypothetical protein